MFVDLRGDFFCENHIVCGVTQDDCVLAGFNLTRPINFPNGSVWAHTV